MKENNTVDYNKGYRSLMLSVLTTQVKDYIKSVRKGGKPAEVPRAYIFENNKESTEYVFGFNFICTYIGLDPIRLRRKIKEMRTEQWADIYKSCK